jgi:hypothetical protein
MDGSGHPRLTCRQAAASQPASDLPARPPARPPADPSCQNHALERVQLLHQRQQRQRLLPKGDGLGGGVACGGQRIPVARDVHVELRHPNGERRPVVGYDPTQDALQTTQERSWFLDLPGVHARTQVAAARQTGKHSGPGAEKQAAYPCLPVPLPAYPSVQTQSVCLPLCGAHSLPQSCGAAWLGCCSRGRRSAACWSTWCQGPAWSGT